MEIKLCISLFVFLTIIYKFLMYKKTDVPFCKLKLKWTVLFSEAEWMYFNTSRFHYYKHLYDEVCKYRYAKFFGNIFSRKLIIIDPKLIEAICVKQFNCFSSRVRSTFLLNDHLTHSIFNLDGEIWHKTRQCFSKAFSTGAMEKMLPLLWHCGVELNKLVSKYLREGESVLDVNELTRLYIGDVISTCVFGQEPGDCFDPSSQFITKAKNLRHRNSSRFMFFDILSSISPNLRHIFGGRIADPEASKYFQKLINENIKLKKKKKSQRVDFLQIFMDFMETKEEALEESSENFKWDLKTTEAHCIVFILGGFTASSAVLSFCLYEIANNTDIQKKLKKEIEEQISLNNNIEIQHKDLQNMKYLDKVLFECLRKYPAFAVNLRVCSKTNHLADTKLVVQKGTPIVISTAGMHHDQRYYPNPEQFDPERFSEAEQMKRSPYTFIPFGIGPRKCIGQRFALLFLKTAVITILTKYTISVPPSENNNPLQFLPRKFTTSSKELKLLFKDVHSVHC